MASAGETIEDLNLQWKLVVKQKLNKERYLCKLRDKEIAFTEDLSTTTSEIEHLTERLQDLKEQVISLRHQILMIEICSASEQSKLETHIDNLNQHKQGFSELVSKERQQTEYKEKELREKEAEEEKVRASCALARQELRERGAREAAARDAERAALLRDCAVLRKRNNAIMLKLRRKLVETENARRDLLKNNTQAGQH